MAKEQKKDLTDKIIDGMRAAKEAEDPWDENKTLRAQAHVAQAETVTLVLNLAQSLTDICVRSSHRGSVKASGNSPAIPCVRCKTKVKHYREIAEFIGPS